MPKDLHASKYKVVPIQRIKANIIISKNSSKTFKRNQFSLTLAGTCAVRNVQGHTLLYSTVVSLESIKPRSFSRGQFVLLYLANVIIKTKISLATQSFCVYLLLFFLTELHLLPSSNLSGITTTYDIIRNDDDEIDKFKSIAVLYNTSNFTCLEQENDNAVPYIKFATTLGSLNKSLTKVKK